MTEKKETLTVNGKPHPHAPGMTVSSLLTALCGEAGAVVVEVNGVIVPRGDFEKTAISADDNVEIVHFVGGG